VQKETFDQFALAKLALMQGLDLPTRDKIHLLIGGITSGSLRATALALASETIEDFLDKMRSIAEGCAETTKKVGYNAGDSKPTGKTCRNCGGANHHHKDCKKELTCFLCKGKGHRRYDCPSLKDEKQQQASRTWQAKPTAAAAIEEEPATESVACVTEPDNRKLEFNGSLVEVDSVEGRNCSLSAIIDTGSPVSFVKYTTYRTIIKPFNIKLEPTDRKFINLKNSPLEIIGTVTIKLTLRQLKGLNLTAELFIIRDQAFSADLIFGREFIAKGKLTVIYRLHEAALDQTHEKVGLFAQLPLNVVENPAKSVRQKIEESNIDFDWRTKKQLVEELTEAEHREVKIMDDDYSVSVRLKDDSLYAYAPRRFAHTQRLEMREITDDLMKRGIIQPSVSPYCARVVPVKKRNGKMRLCIDLRPLNSRVEKQKFPFPNIEDCLSRLAGRSVFTLLDLKDGFHQIKVNKDSTKYFAFATPDGQFEYKRLPFGFSEAPDKFQKRIMQILQPLIRKDKVIVYVDDVLIPSENVEENIQTIKEVLITLKRYGFELNYDKCQFLRTRIEFLGYIVTPTGITLSPRHTEAVKRYKRPKNVIQLQRFLGLAGYFRKFVRDFATKAKPLYNLLKKNTPYDFNEECDRSFELLKKELTAEPVLALFNPTVETELHTDASVTGIGAILLQKQQSGVWAVVAYYSQATNQAKTRYHSFELEMLAIVRAVERFHLYLYGLHFTIITDCNALVYAVNKANLNPRIARWTLALQNYNCKLIHRAGNKMKHVDALSREIGYVNEVALERELELQQLADPVISNIANELEFKDNEKFTLVDGLVYRKDDENLKFVVPDGMIGRVLRAHHDDMAHCGSEKTYQGVAISYWFPAMRKKIHDYISNCFTCIMADDSRNRLEGETNLYPQANAALDTLHIDHFGLLQESRDHFKYIFVVVDAFTRFTWLCPVKATTTNETVRHLKNIFSIFGNPSKIVSDRGTAFTSREFEKFIEARSIKHRKVAVASPWANGTVERINRFIKSSLVKICDSSEDWKDKLHTLQYVINNTYHSVTKSTPSRLMFGFDRKSHVDYHFARYTKQLANIDLDVENERTEACDLAATATNAIQQYNKKYREDHSRKPSVYNEGDYVVIRDTRAKPGENPKIKPKYKGPYIVAKTLGNNRYVIRDIPGFNVTSRPYNSVLSSDKLKYWIKPIRPIN